LKRKIKTMFGDPKRINVLLLGSGGREHCLAEALSRSRITGDLHCAPGNPGMEALADVHDVDICNKPSVRNLCSAYDIELAVIGPEAPLAAGIADDLRANGVKVFGPGASGARLESSKAFAKLFMRRHGIPTSRFDICSDIDECRGALLSRTPPYVIKADGLAAGAIGGRLTGAGWGGCAVFLLTSDQDPNAFIAALKGSYYRKRRVESPIVFATKPGTGAVGFRF
jgi:hypothetical protein